MVPAVPILAVANLAVPTKNKGSKGAKHEMRGIKILSDRTQNTNVTNMLSIYFIPVHVTVGLL